MLQQGYTSQYVANLHKWIEKHSITVDGYPTFIPENRLINHLTSNDLSVLESVLREFYKEKTSIYLKRIANGYLRVFCILLEIERLDFLEQFLNKEQLNDARLPFKDIPHGFPSVPTRPNLFTDFCAAQWKYSPATLTYLQQAELDAIHALPFEEKTLEGAGNSSNVYKIKISQCYRTFDPLDCNIGTDLFALKEFHGDGSMDAWRRESAAFEEIQSGDSHISNIVKYYCSFKHGQKYGMIFEFADKKTLEGYLKNTAPPVEAVDIIALLEGLFGLLKGLRELHDGRVRIWHQDIKPANILVFSNIGNESLYHCRFKIADLGTSHSRPYPGSDIEDDTDQDSWGTKTYGAPECHRVDSPLGGGPFRVQCKVDIWSLGCILSEVLVWIVWGPQGLYNYSTSRSDAIHRLPSRDSGDSFHNGYALLPQVSSWHNEIIRHEANAKGIFDGVILLINGMLRPASDRKESNYYCTRAHEIVVGLKERFLDQNSKGSIATNIDVPPPSQLGSPSSSGITSRVDMRPSTKEPVWLPPMKPSNLRQKAISDQKPPSLSFKEAKQWHSKRKQFSIGSQDKLRDSSVLNLLGNRDMIFLIDDAESMRSHWVDVSDLFHILAYMVKKRDHNGVDLVFTSSEKAYHQKHSTPLAKEVEMRDRQKDRGQSDMSLSLGHLLEDFGRRIELASRRIEKKPSMNVYVFTDGIWNPHCDIVPAIEKIVNTMVKYQVPRSALGLQFISFGNDTEALAKLQIVDNSLDLPLDIVDTTHFDGDVYKMVLGACHIWYDEAESSVEASQASH